MLNDIHRWYRYAQWANAHMLDACDTLDPAALTREMGTSFGTVLGTLEHIYGADWLWLERWEGRSPSAFPTKGALPTVAALRDVWAGLDARRSAYLATLDEARIAGPLRYHNIAGAPMEFVLGDILFHVSNHATYHRGQVMQLVKQLGGTVQSTDYFFWLPEHR